MVRLEIWDAIAPMFCEVCLEALVGAYVDISLKVRADLYEEFVEIFHNCLWLFYQICILNYGSNTIVIILILTYYFVDHAPRFPEIYFIFCET